MPPMPPPPRLPPRRPPEPLATLRDAKKEQAGNQNLPWPLQHLGDFGFLEGSPTALVPSGNTGEKIIATGGLVGLTTLIPPLLPLSLIIGAFVWGDVDPIEGDAFLPGVIGSLGLKFPPALPPGNGLDPGAVLTMILVDP